MEFNLKPNNDPASDRRQKMALRPAEQLKLAEHRDDEQKVSRLYTARIWL